MPIDKTVPAPRASSVTFELPDGSKVRIPPVSIDQARACLRLDPDAGHQETHKEFVLRLNEQARILLGPDFAYLTGVLTILQITEVVGCLYVAACGMDAETYAKWQKGQRNLTAKHEAYEALRNLEGLTIELAAELGKLPSEIGATPLADANALLEKIRERTKEDFEFQAAIHGATRQ